MSELTTKRTLVKSPPELWAEVSDLEALTKHLGEFGEIRITRLEPETTVVWEGDRASGTVKLEPSGWGTKVTLTAELAAIGEPAAREEPPVEEPPVDTATLSRTVSVEAPPLSPIEEEVTTAKEPQAAEEPPAAEETATAEEPPAVEEPQAAEEPQASEAPLAAPAKKLGFWARLFGRKKALAEVPPPETPQTPPPVEEPEPEPEPVEEPPAPEPPPLQPLPEPEPEPEPEPDEPLPAAAEPAATLDDDRAVAVLTEALDNLGAAHHRPFSRG